MKFNVTHLLWNRGLTSLIGFFYEAFRSIVINDWYVYEEKKYNNSTRLKLFYSLRSVSESEEVGGNEWRAQRVSSFSLKPTFPVSLKDSLALRTRELFVLQPPKEA